MHRRAMLAAAALLPVRAARADGLAAAGWTHQPYAGIAPARFTALPDGGLRIEGEGVGSFVWRRVAGAAGCLSWRWRVDAGPPPTPLTRRGGDDRAISVAVGFDGFPPTVTAWQRAQHGIAQARAGSHRLPRSLLVYVWGGSSHEPRHFYSPWAAGLAKVFRLRPAYAPFGQWFEERVDLAADWRFAFGADPPPLQEIAIGTDVDDTGARIDARVEAIRFFAC
ncbi:MAG: DUF3047 domain-containing protein [Rhodovarius sp.]|nr:DUF3047 domain-containing protein [Rhodovarius sp.]MCX7933026.1 DUF3047 domain-containing protein [Rhodovarius sp.]MDW8314258.1 DUF3047 domain-containing protein [Rhodovarius sp.]